MNKTILLIGACGSGKTWVMKSLIDEYSLNLSAKYNLIRFRTNKKIAVLGKYDGTTFEGSDKLSMGVAVDFEKFSKMAEQKNLIVIAEGDRFTNSRFISHFKPVIIRIKDDGKEGRKKRNSSQTERHIKAIETRVKNIKPKFEVKNSSEALKIIKSEIK